MLIFTYRNPRKDWDTKIIMSLEKICPIIVAVLYAITAVAYFRKAEHPLGLMWACYSVSNIAIVWACWGSSQGSH